MSEERKNDKSAPRRRYNNRNRSRNRTQKDKSPALTSLGSGMNSSSSSSSLSSLQSNNASKSTRPQRKQKPKLSLNPEDSRNEEIKSLIYKLSSLKTFKLINSNSKQKIFRCDIYSQNSYKIMIPIDKRIPISIQSIEDVGHNKFVIRNFNNKSKSNDKSLLFYLNYLLNNYENLSMSPNDYKHFEINKFL